jgi:2,3-bisphosphoglycerate-independent phosphoglycerate mutase
MVIIDGMADEKIAALRQQTTYEYSRHPNLDRWTAGWFTGRLQACPEGWQPESMPCILNLLAVPTEYFPRSRASLELLAHGYTLKPDEVVLRCNLVAVDDRNRLSSFNGGQLTNREMRKAAGLVSTLDADIRFWHLSGYRNLLILKKQDLGTADCKTYPPHESLGENISELLAETFKSSETIRNFVRTGADVMQKKFGRGKDRYLFYPWGFSERNSLPLFEDLHGRKGAAVCGAEIAKGIALALGMFVPDLKGATADTDTNLALKAQTACNLLQEYDFVLIHINGADEASHRCNCQEKIQFIERIDQEFIGYLMNHLDKQTGVLLCADHATSPVTGKHSALAVPFMMRKRAGIVPGWDLRNEMQVPPIVGAAEVFQYFLAQ